MKTYPEIKLWCPECSIRGVGCKTCNFVGKLSVCEACLDTGIAKQRTDVDSWKEIDCLACDRRWPGRFGIHQEQLEIVEQS